VFRSPRWFVLQHRTRLNSKKTQDKKKAEHESPCDQGNCGDRGRVEVHRRSEARGGRKGTTAGREKWTKREGREGKR